ncbi:MAG: hypothetical protein K6A80_06205 [Saccharofermentans sp.]|nr:hypothetical protein [Saccharofermentans sp.]
MENNELNLDELMEINGGNNEAALYLEELAKKRSLVRNDGMIDLIALRKSLTPGELARITALRRILGGELAFRPIERNNSRALR